MKKFFTNENGSATVQYSMVLALVSMMMFSGVINFHSKQPTINKLNAAFIHKH